MQFKCPFCGSREYYLTVTHVAMFQRKDPELVKLHKDDNQHCYTARCHGKSCDCGAMWETDSLWRLAELMIVDGALK